MTSEELKAHRNDHWDGDIPFPRTNALAVERSHALDDEVYERFTEERKSAAERTLKGGGA